MLLFSGNVSDAARQIAQAIGQPREIVIFTGAGVSADSGIPTFRDGATGLWVDVDPMDVASIEGFERNPEKVWAWHEEMRQRFASAKPNPGHRAIALLESLLPDARITVVTQNIDGLHQDAGSSRVLEIHGSARRLRCHLRCGFSVSWLPGIVEAHTCPECGALLRPDVVWFGEALDPDFDHALDAAARANVLFAVGTSSVVQPAAQIPLVAIDAGATVIEINPHITPLTRLAYESMRFGAAEFFPALCKALRQQA